MLRAVAALALLQLAASASPSDVPGLTLVSLPAGSFVMGEDQSTGSFENANSPAHTVSLDAFHLADTQVTNAQFAAYLNDAWADGLLELGVVDTVGLELGLEAVLDAATGDEVIVLGGEAGEDEDPINECWIAYDPDADEFAVEDPDKADWPVVFVRWYGAALFADYYGLQLPTEAQWEYAARAGTDFHYPTDDGTISNAKANYNGDDPVGHPLPVRSLPPNAWGLYEMGGQVWEWCYDWYATDYYSVSPASNPQGPDGEEPPTDGSATGGPAEEYSHDTRVIRGGAYNYHVDTMEVSYRRGDYPFRGNDHFGFRVAFAGELAAAPGAPTDVAAVAGDGEAVVSWTAPAGDITGYVVTHVESGAASSSGTTATSLTVAGLPNNEPATFVVAAVNAEGQGADSAASAAVTPRAATLSVSPASAVAGVPLALTVAGYGFSHADRVVLRQGTSCWAAADEGADAVFVADYAYAATSAHFTVLVDTLYGAEQQVYAVCYDFAFDGQGDFSQRAGVLTVLAPPAVDEDDSRSAINGVATELVVTGGRLSDRDKLVVVHGEDCAAQTASFWAVKEATLTSIDALGTTTTWRVRVALSSDDFAVCYRAALGSGLALLSAGRLAVRDVPVAQRHTLASPVTGASSLVVIGTNLSPDDRVVMQQGTACAKLSYDVGDDAYVEASGPRSNSFTVTVPDAGTWSVCYMYAHKPLDYSNKVGASVYVAPAPAVTELLTTGALAEQWLTVQVLGVALTAKDAIALVASSCEADAQSADAVKQAVFVNLDEDAGIADFVVTVAEAGEYTVCYDFGGLGDFSAAAGVLTVVDQPSVDAGVEVSTFAKVWTDVVATGFGLVADDTLKLVRGADAECALADAPDVRIEAVAAGHWSVYVPYVGAYTLCYNGEEAFGALVVAAQPSVSSLAPTTATAGDAVSITVRGVELAAADELAFLEGPSCPTRDDYAFAAPATPFSSAARANVFAVDAPASAGTWAACYRFADVEGYALAGYLTVADAPAVVSFAPATVLARDVFVLAVDGTGLTASDSLGFSSSDGCGARLGGSSVQAVPSVSVVGEFTVAIVPEGSFTVCYDFGGAGEWTPVGTIVVEAAGPSASAVAPRSLAYGEVTEVTVEGDGLSDEDSLVFVDADTACGPVLVPSVWQHSSEPSVAAGLFDVRLVPPATASFRACYSFGSAADYSTDLGLVEVVVAPQATGASYSTDGLVVVRGVMLSTDDAVAVSSDGECFPNSDVGVTASSVNDDLTAASFAVALSAAGTYTVCYSYGGHDDFSTVAGTFTVDSLPTAFEATPAAAVTGEFFTLQVSGTQLSATDRVHVVAGDDCDGSSVAAQSAFQSATGDTATFFLVTMSEAGEYSVCYEFANSGEHSTKAGSLTVADGPSVTGVSPTVAEVGVTVELEISGAGLTDEDGVALYYGTTCAGKAASEDVANLEHGKLRVTALGVFSVCYRFGASGDFAAKAGEIEVVEEPAALALQPTAVSVGVQRRLSVRGYRLSTADRMGLVPGSSCLAAGLTPDGHNELLLSAAAETTDGVASFDATVPAAGEWAVCYSFGGAADYTTRVGVLTASDLPAVSDVQPTTLRAHEVATVTLTGTGFGDGDELSFGSSSSSSVQSVLAAVSGATQLTFTVGFTEAGSYAAQLVSHATGAVTDVGVIEVEVVRAASLVAPLSLAYGEVTEVTVEGVGLSDEDSLVFVDADTACGPVLVPSVWQHSSEPSVAAGLFDVRLVPPATTSFRACYSFGSAADYSTDAGLVEVVVTPQVTSASYSTDGSVVVRGVMLSTDDAVAVSSDGECFPNSDVGVTASSVNDALTAASFAVALSAAGTYTVCYSYGGHDDFSTVAGTFTVDSLPTVIETAPTAAVTGEFFTLQVSGTQLSATDRVHVVAGDDCDGSSVAAQSAFQSATGDTATFFLVTMSEAGEYSVCYEFANSGEHSTKAGSLTVADGPSVTGVSPTVAEVGVTVELEISGAGLTDEDGVALYYGTTCAGKAASEDVANLEHGKLRVMALGTFSVCYRFGASGDFAAKAGEIEVVDVRVVTRAELADATVAAGTSTRLVVHGAGLSASDEAALVPTDESCAEARRWPVYTPSAWSAAGQSTTFVVTPEAEGEWQVCYELAAVADSDVLTATAVPSATRVTPAAFVTGAWEYVYVEGALLAEDDVLSFSSTSECADAADAAGQSALSHLISDTHAVFVVSFSSGAPAAAWACYDFGGVGAPTAFAEVAVSEPYALAGVSPATVDVGVATDVVVSGGGLTSADSLGVCGSTSVVAREADGASATFSLTLEAAGEWELCHVHAVTGAETAVGAIEAVAMPEATALSPAALAVDELTLVTVTGSGLSPWDDLVVVQHLPCSAATEDHAAVVRKYINTYSSHESVTFAVQVEEAGEFTVCYRFGYWRVEYGQTVGSLVVG